MKTKKLTLLTLLIVLVSCNSKEPIIVEEYDNLKIDSCDYIGYRAGGGGYYGIAHKGNCKNCKKVIE